MTFLVVDMKFTMVVIFFYLLLGITLESFSQSHSANRKYVAWVTLTDSGQIIKGLITNLGDESITLISLDNLEKYSILAPVEISVDDIKVIKIRKKGVTGAGFAIFGGAGFIIGFSALMYFGPALAIIGGIAYTLTFGVIGWAIFSGRKKFSINGNGDNYLKVHRKLLGKFIYQTGLYQRT